MRILILGAGGQGQVLADALRFAAEAGQPVTPVGYLDDNPALWQRAPLGLPVLGALAAWRDIDHDALLLGIGANRRRCELYTALAAEGAHFTAFCHPTALVGHDVVVCPGYCTDVVRTLSRWGAAELQRMETPTDRVHRQRMLALSALVFHPL